MPLYYCPPLFFLSICVRSHFLSMGFNSRSCSHLNPSDVWPRALLYASVSVFKYIFCISWTDAILLVRLTRLLSVHHFSSPHFCSPEIRRFLTQEEHLFFWAFLFPSTHSEWCFTDEIKSPSPCTQIICLKNEYQCCYMRRDNVFSSIKVFSNECVPLISTYHNESWHSLIAVFFYLLILSSKM